MQYEEFYFISRHNRVNPQAFFYENSFNLLKKIPKIFQELEIDFTCVHYFINKTGAPLSCVIICLAHSGQQWCVTISAQFLASQLICHVKKPYLRGLTILIIDFYMIFCEYFRKLFNEQYNYIFFFLNNTS